MSDNHANNKAIEIYQPEKTLQVLKEIEHNPQVTQRILAQKLEIRGHS